MQHLERSVIVACRATRRFWGPVPWREEAWESKRGFATRYFTQEGADEAFAAACVDSPERAQHIVFEYWDQRDQKQQAAD